MLVELIKRVRFRDRVRYKFMREKMMFDAIKQAPYEADGGQKLIAEVIFGDGLSLDQDSSLIDDLDHAGDPTTEECANHPIYQKALRAWILYERKKRKALMENRSS